MNNHILFLNSNMYKLIKSIKYEQNKMLVPTLFEYYSAVKLTHIYQRPFWVWKDILPIKKQKANFSITDKGIDISDETFTIIGQSKYYSPKNYITYGKLSTFLATKVLVGRHDIQFNLIRTDDCKIQKNVQSIINRGDLTDVCVDRNEFKYYCDNL